MTNPLRIFDIDGNEIGIVTEWQFMANDRAITLTPEDMPSIMSVIMRDVPDPEQSEDGRSFTWTMPTSFDFSFEWTDVNVTRFFLSTAKASRSPNGSRREARRARKRRGKR